MTDKLINVRPLLLLKTTSWTGGRVFWKWKQCWHQSMVMKC